MNKKLLKPIALILVAALLIGSSLAYFTDRAETQATGTAGTVAISLANNINFLDADGQDIINPGDQRAAAFAVTNEGNKSIDIRTTVALTALDYAGQPINFSGDTDVQSEYDLYLASDVELVEGKGYAPKADAAPLQVKSINGNVITYILPVYSLNGNSDKYTEYETIDGVDAFTKNHDLVMVMKGEAGNAWQASSLKMDVLVEAKQHENTAAGWNIVATENVTHGSINQDAVLAEDVITDEAGISNGTITFSLRDANRDAGISNVTMKLVKLPENTLSAVDTLGGTVLATVRSDANGTGRFTRLEEGKYALVSPNFVLTTEAENLEIVGVDGTDHYEYNGTVDWAATIEGTIKNAEGQGVPDVDVNIVDNNQDFVAGSTTDTNGDYAIYPVVEGSYTIEVEGNEITSGSNTVTATEGNTATADEITVTPTTPVIPDEPVTPVVGATFNKYLTNSSCHANYWEHEDSCYTDCNDTLTWDELKLAENGTKYVYKADLITDNALLFDDLNYQGAFGGCPGLVSITLPTTVTTIGDFTFNSVLSLESINLHDGITSIGTYCFMNCVGLSDIKIPAGVTTIKEATFRGCNGLTNVVIPDSVESLETNAFYGCANLSSVTIGSGVTNIGNGVFESCTNLQTFTVSESNQKYVSVDGVLFNKEQTTLVAYPAGRTGTYAIPAGVTTIGPSAFAYSQLTNVEIPDSVTSIDSTSFYSSKLTSIEIPQSITTVGSCWFNGCEQLSTVTIPTSVTTIEAQAFSQSVTDIHYNGTQAEWNSINKATGEWPEDCWDNGMNSYTIHCTDGDISK